MNNKRKQEIENYWMQNAKRMAVLKGKRTLTPEEWKSIAYETWAISLNNSWGGGSVCGASVRVARNHLDLLESGIRQPNVFRNESPSMAEMIVVTKAALAKAREGLRIHNAQEDRATTYDLETGEFADESTVEVKFR